MQKEKKFAITGADPLNGNLGLGALTFGSLEAVYTAYPNATVVMLDYYKYEDILEFEFDGKLKHIERIGVRFSWKLFLRNNIMLLITGALLIKIFPFKFFIKLVYSLVPTLKEISKIDIAYSISGGDSFSDIYGLARFFYVALPQILYLLMGVPLIHLPQTFGPYKHFISRFITRLILSRSKFVYSRDEYSLNIVKSLNKNKTSHQNCSFCYDVGFLLKPKTVNEVIVKSQKNLVGINISGLLLKGGYKDNNQFGLTLEYEKACYNLVRLFIEKLQCNVLLVPHVFDTSTENDLNACEYIYNKLNIRQGIFCIRKMYNSQEIKGIIKKCSFFVGSRMHACIGAISQFIPTVPLAYSRKFIGVMGSIGMEDCVVDLCTTNIEEMIDKIEKLYFHRQQIESHLNNIIPIVQTTVRKIFVSNVQL